MNNPELKQRIDRVAEALEGIEAGFDELLEEQELAREQALNRALLAARALPRAWPWTPNTVAQGFLAGRWLRRDGNVYAGAALRGIKGPNSPIRGGDDNQAKVDVPSGAPRA